MALSVSTDEMAHAICSTADVDLSMEDIEIPHWRVGTGRLMSDVCQFCIRNPDTHHKALLDPVVNITIYSLKLRSSI